MKIGLTSVEMHLNILIKFTTREHQQIDSNFTGVYILQNTGNGPVGRVAAGENKFKGGERKKREN